MKTNRKNKIWQFPKLLFFVFSFCLFCLYIKYAYLSLSPTIYGKNMAEFAASRNTVKKTIKAKRGTIYDIDGNSLAINVSSYTIILSLKKSSVYNGENYVHDIDLTATSISPILGCDVDYVKEKLNQIDNLGVFTTVIVNDYKDKDYESIEKYEGNFNLYIRGEVR